MSVESVVQALCFQSQKRRVRRNSSRLPLRHYGKSASPTRSDPRYQNCSPLLAHSIVIHQDSSKTLGTFSRLPVEVNETVLATPRCDTTTAESHFSVMRCELQKRSPCGSASCGGVTGVFVQPNANVCPQIKGVVRLGGSSVTCLPVSIRQNRSLLLSDALLAPFAATSPNVNHSEGPGSAVYEGYYRALSAGQSKTLVAYIYSSLLRQQNICPSNKANASMPLRHIAETASPLLSTVSADDREVAIRDAVARNGSWLLHCTERNVELLFVPRQVAWLPREVVRDAREKASMYHHAMHTLPEQKATAAGIRDPQRALSNVQFLLHRCVRLGKFIQSDSAQRALGHVLIVLLPVVMAAASKAPLGKLLVELLEIVTGQHDVAQRPQGKALAVSPRPLLARAARALITPLQIAAQQPVALDVADTSERYSQPSVREVLAAAQGTASEFFFSLAPPSEQQVPPPAVRPAEAVVLCCSPRSLRCSRRTDLSAADLADCQACNQSPENGVNGERLGNFMMELNRFDHAEMTASDVRLAAHQKRRRVDESLSFLLP